MECKVVIAGVGGQGIQVASQLLCHAALPEGKRALYLTKFQGAQRGGLCECLIALAEGRVNVAPVIMQPLDGCLAMHPDSFQRFESLVEPGGLLAYNTSIKFGSNAEALTAGGRGSMPIGMAMKAEAQMELRPKRTDIAYLPIPATDLAVQEFGNTLPATLIGLGALVELSGVVNFASVLAALPKVLPPHRRHLLTVNENALSLGRRWVKDNADQTSDLGRMTTFRADAALFGKART